MGNKILVEFDRRELLKGCEKDREMFLSSKERTTVRCVRCKRTDEDLVYCQAVIIKYSFKIKEQNNGNKQKKTSL